MEVIKEVAEGDAYYFKRDTFIGRIIERHTLLPWEDEVHYKDEMVGWLHGRVWFEDAPHLAHLFYGVKTMEVRDEENI